MLLANFVDDRCADRIAKNVDAGSKAIPDQINFINSSDKNRRKFAVDIFKLRILKFYETALNFYFIISIISDNKVAQKKK